MILKQIRKNMCLSVFFNPKFAITTKTRRLNLLNYNRLTQDFYYLIVARVNIRKNRITLTPTPLPPDEWGWVRGKTLIYQTNLEVQARIVHF